MIRFHTLLLAAPLLLVGCAHGRQAGGKCLTKPLPAFSREPRATGPAPDHEASDVVVRSLGAAGLYVERGGHGVLLSARFTSYPPDAGAHSKRVAPDAKAIARGLDGLDKENIRAILAGSGDWDNLADVVELARALPHADVYTNAAGLASLATHVAELEGTAEVEPEVPEAAPEAGEVRATDRLEKLEQAPVPEAEQRRSKRKRVGSGRRVRAVDGQSPPRMAEQWTYLQGARGSEAPIRVRALPLAGDAGEPPPPADKPLDKLHTTELQEGRPYAYALEFLDEQRARVEFRMLVVGAGTQPQLGDLDKELDLVVIGMRRHAATNARPAAFLGDLKAAHVAFVDFDQAGADGVWSLHPRVEAGWLGSNVCAVDGALTSTGLRERVPRGFAGTHGTFWSLPTPGQWLVFATGMGGGEAPEEPGDPLQAAYDRALLQATELDMEGAWKTLSGAIAAAQKRGSGEDPALARPIALAAAVLMSKDKDPAKATALLERAVSLDYYVGLPVELASPALKKALAKVRGGMSPPREPLQVFDPVARKDGSIAFRAHVQMETPPGAQVVLYWRKTGGGEFTALELATNGNLATAALPAVAHRGSDLDYFVYVFDAKQQPLANKGTAEEPVGFFPKL